MSEKARDDSTPQDLTDRGVLIEALIHCAPRSMWVKFRVTEELLLVPTVGLPGAAEFIGTMIIEQFQRLRRGEASMNYAQQGQVSARELATAHAETPPPFTQQILDEAITDHLILYGNPEAPPAPLRFHSLSPKGVEGWPPPETVPFCTWGPECPFHPEGKGGPWVL